MTGAIIISDDLVIQGVPKNALSECCWSYSALAQSQVAGTPCVWKLICGRFLILLRLSLIKPSKVMFLVKSSPTALNIGYDFVLLVHFFGTTCMCKSLNLTRQKKKIANDALHALGSCSKRFLIFNGNPLHHSPCPCLRSLKNSKFNDRQIMYSQNYISLSRPLLPSRKCTNILIANTTVRIITTRQCCRIMQIVKYRFWFLVEKCSNKIFSENQSKRFLTVKDSRDWQHFINQLTLATGPELMHLQWNVSLKSLLIKQRLSQYLQGIQFFWAK